MSLLGRVSLWTWGNRAVQAPLGQGWLAVLQGWWVNQVCCSFWARSKYLLRASLLCSQQNGREQLPICLSSRLYYILLPAQCTAPGPLPVRNESGLCPHGWPSCCPSAFSTCASQCIFLWLWVSRGEGLVHLCVYVLIHAWGWYIWREVYDSLTHSQMCKKGRQLVNVSTMREHPWHLEQRLAHSSCLIDISWTNECIRSLHIFLNLIIVNWV